MFETGLVDMNGMIRHGLHLETLLAINESTTMVAEREYGLTSMPGSPDALSSLEPSNALADSDDVSNRLMSRHARKHVSQITLLYKKIGVTDAAGEYLHQNIAWAGLLDLNVSESQFGTFVLEERRLVSCWKRYSHA